MCLALISTSHPQYPLILINNRDEYISRRTAKASWWQAPNTHVLGGRDLQRSVQGTWLGVTKQGRIAVLTNFREEGQQFSGVKSRGAIVNSFLTLSPESTETPKEFARRLVEDVGVTDVGGFSLCFGQLQRPSRNDGTHKGLAIVSNRTPDTDGIVWIAEGPGETHGLSNSHYGDLSWPKVVHGQQLLRQLVYAHDARKSDKADLIARLLDVLSIDTLPKIQKDESWETYIRQLRNSIFIPRVGGEGTEGNSADELHAARSTEPVTSSQGSYATQKQTVVLVDLDGHVTFVEKTLYDEQGDPLNEDDAVETFEFDIEGW